MLNISSLNPPQKLCVETISGPIALLAGAGTGKTRVISYRVANMVQKGIRPENIVAVTFTNKAAKEMRERIGALVGADAKKLWLGTFHSFCLKILRSHFAKAGLEPRFTIITTADQIELVRKSLEEKGLHGVYRAEWVHQSLSYCKNQLWGKERILQAKSEDFNNYEPELIAEIFELYERRLRLNHAIDFDDCIYKTALLLDRDSDLLAKLQQQYQYILVDEFQDTNLSQLKILGLLAKEHKNICVVGDDDQSIYSWRGAKPDILLRFEELFPTRELIKLEQNYRCTANILSAANQLIKNNRQRKEKSLWCDKDQPIPISLAQHKNETEEAEWIAQSCLGLLGKGFRHQDIAILYRANNQNKALEIAFRTARLRYKVFGGQSFFSRKEVKDVLAYLQLIANPNHRHGFWRIINTPARGFGLKTLETIEEVARTHKISPFAVLNEQISSLPSRVQEDGRNFAAQVAQLRAMPLNTKEDVASLAMQTIKLFHIESVVRATKSSEDATDAKLQSLWKIPQWLSDIAQARLNDTGKIDLDDIIDSLTLDESDKEEDEKKRDQISLMTIHAAKGLEFGNVFLCGVEEDLLPHKNSVLEAGGIEEERRLFYVAITRAKEKLFLSHCRERGALHQKMSRKPSRFLQELPNNIVVPVSELILESVAPEVRKERTLGRLARIRQEIQS